MIDYSFIIGGVLCAWVFLLMLSHERQRRMDEIRAGTAPAPIPPTDDEIPIVVGSPSPSMSSLRPFSPSGASPAPSTQRKSGR